VELPPHSTKVFPTNVKICFPEGYHGLILSRPSGASKGLVVEGGIVESSDAPINIILHNNSLRVFNIHHANPIGLLCVFSKPNMKAVCTDVMGDVWEK